MTDTPVVSDALRLVRVLFSPGNVFQEIKEKPSFLVPWIIVSVVFGALTFLAAPFQARIMRMAAEQAGQPLPPFLEKITYFTAFTAPVTVLAMSALTALVLWVVMMASGEDAPYQSMLTIVIFSWSVGLIQQTLNVVVLSMRGVESIQSPMDLQVSLGLDLLLPAEAEVGPFLRAVLAGIGPLQIWALVIIAVGLMVLTGASRARAWTAAAIQFAVGLLIASGLAALGAGRFQS